ncbi:MAG: PAS domain-containing protein [Polyangiales bacterium]
MSTFRSDSTGGEATDALRRQPDTARSEPLALDAQMEEARWQAEVLAGADVGLWRVDVATGAARWSATFGALCGLEGDGAIDLAAWEARVHPDDRAAWRELAAKGEREGGVWERDYRVLRGDGTTRWLHERVRVRRDDAGRAVCHDGVALEVTARREREARLRLDAERLERAVRQARVVAWEWDCQADRVDTTANVEEVYGVPAVAFAAQGFSLVHPDDRERHVAAVRRAAGEGVAYRSEFRVVRPDDGRVVFIEEHAVPERDAGGRVLRVVGAAIDVTERRSAIDRAAEATERFELAERAADGYLYDWDARRGTVARSANFHRVLGYGPDEVAPTPAAWHELMHPDDRALLEADGRLALARQTTEYERTYRARHRRGHWVTLLDKGSAIYDREGRHLRTVGMTVDVSARAEAERALRQAVTQLRLVSDIAPVYIARCDPERRYRFVNRAYAARFGEDPDALVGRPICEVLGGDVLDLLEPYIREVLAGRPVEFDLEVPYAKLGSRFMHCAYAPERDAEGAVVGWVSAVTDLTERRRIEEALEASEANFRGLCESLPQFTYVTERDGRLSYVNHRWVEFSGLSLEATNDPEAVARVFHPDDRALVAERWRRAAEAGAELDVEARMVGRGGEVRWFLIRAVPVRDEAGAVLRWVGSSTDVTGGREAAERLQEQQRFVENVIAAAPTLTYIYNLQTCCNEFISQQSEAVLGRPPGGLAAMGPAVLSDLVHPDDLPRVEARLRDIAASREQDDAFEIEYRMRRADGDWVWLLSRDRVFDRDARGAPRRIVGVATDITSRKRDEAERERALREVRAAREAAEAAARAKDEFLAVVSHELRNPLNAVLGYVTLLREADDLASARRYGAIIERNTRMQQRLVSDLLDVARVITGKLTLEVDRADLRAVVDDATAVVRPSAELKGIALHVDDAANAPVIAGDPARLLQVVLNLLQNAVKFTPPGGRVELALRAEGEWVRLVVRDTGCGIEPGFLPHVFDRFTQSDMSRTRHHGGLGLGLALVKHLVELHGGSVEARSEGAGRGSTFTVVLPLRAPSAQEPASSLPPASPAPSAPEAVAEPPRLDGLRVLVVDDDDDSRAMLEECLVQFGAAVEVADSAAAALVALEGGGFDVLLSDIAMPGLSGEDLVRHVRAAEQARGAARPLPALAMSGLSRAEDRARAFAAGFHAHVTKPLEVAELAVTIRRLC